jgi:hypothetical protein
MRSAGEAYMQSEAARALRRELAERDRRASRPGRSLWWLTLAPPLAAAAVWMFLLRSRPPSDLVAKGAGTVELLVGHEGRLAPWTGGALARGDLLELSWTSARSAYVAVIGREDGGATSQWFPAGDEAARLEAGAQVFGDALRFDPPFHGSVYAFFSPSVFPTRELEAAIREGREPAFSGQTIRLNVPSAP